MSDKKPAEADAAAPKKSKKKLIIIAVAVALVLLLGGGGGAYFMITKKKAEEAAAAEAEEADAGDAAKGGKDGKEGKDKKAKKKKGKAKDKDKEAEKPVYVEAEPFTVNLADVDTPRMAQFKLTLQIDNEKVAEDVKNMMPALRNNILLLLGSKSSAQIATRENKENLAKEIIETCNAALEGSPAADTVTGVLFQNIIIQ